MPWQIPMHKKKNSSKIISVPTRTVKPKSKSNPIALLGPQQDRAPRAHQIQEGARNPHGYRGGQAQNLYRPLQLCMANAPI